MLDAAPVINEIHFDPPDKTTPSEFIEIYNPNSTPVALAGWRLSGGADVTFEAGVSIPGDDYLIVAKDAAAFQARFGFVPDVVWESGDSLSNSGEQITLRDLRP